MASTSRLASYVSYGSTEMTARLGAFLVGLMGLLAVLCTSTLGGCGQTNHPTADVLPVEMDQIERDRPDHDDPRSCDGLDATSCEATPGCIARYGPSFVDGQRATTDVAYLGCDALPPTAPPNVAPRSEPNKPMPRPTPGNEPGDW
jgi:hypothetical protein